MEKEFCTRSDLISYFLPMLGKILRWVRKNEGEGKNSWDFLHGIKIVRTGD